MRALKTRTATLAVLGLVSGAAIFAAAGCELSVTYEDPNPDSSIDAGPDGAGDSGPDVTTDADLDATTDADASVDAGDADADTSVDAGPDVFVNPDGSVANAAAIAQFQADQVAAFCSALQNACGNPVAWQVGKCTTTYLAGFANLYEDLLVPGVTAGGRLQLDAAKAASCISAIRAIPLPVRTAAEHAAIVNACKDAVVGLQPIGAECRTNIECKPNEACKNIVNGVGACAPLDGAGDRCEYPTTGRARSNTCSYRGIGDNGRFCSNTDNVSGVCVDLFPLGQSCVFDTQCASNLCGPNAAGDALVCVDSYNELTTNGTCGYFTTP